MAIAKITIWLNDVRRDYEYGVLLYNQFGKSELQKVFFKNGNSPFHQDKLFTALEELNPSLEELTNKSSFKIPTLENMPIPVKRYGLTDEAWDKLPEQIRTLYVDNSKLHAHSRLLFDQARIARNDEDRGLLGREILFERNLLNNNWKDIKDYFSQGKIKDQLEGKEKENLDDLTILELTKKLANIPSYLCKDRKTAITMTAGSKLNAVLLRIQKNEIKLELIKKRLEEIK